MADAELFGVDPQKAERERHAAEFREASVSWAKLYLAQERQPYIWRSRCNKHLADILAELRRASECPVKVFAGVATEYLRDRWNGYDGHELKSLWRDLAKFRARATQNVAGQVKKFQDN